MISFEDFLMLDTSPIYVQILLYIKRGVVAGTIMDGDELPSRRMLSARLGVNPNTVQKAYRMLEEDAREAVNKLRQMGVSMEEAIGLIRKYWN